MAFRKTAHLAFYGFAGYAAWRGAAQAGAWRHGRLLFAFGAALLIATFDELRQSTQIGRSGSIWDVLLDMVGAFVTVGLAHGLSGKRAQ